MSSEDDSTAKPLAGRTALITGAGGGLGAQLARALADAGADLVLHGRQKSASLKMLATSLHAAFGTTVTTAFADLADEASIDAMFEPGGPAFTANLLVNNAGIYPTRDFADLDLSDWEDVMIINVYAAARCIQLITPAMIRSGGGSVVSIGSIAAQRSPSDQIHYAASKAALGALSRGAAVALAPHRIRVNMVSPGLLSRPGIGESWPDGVTRWRNASPLGELISPDAVARACLFLLSDASESMTGQELIVDGGLSATSDY
ncbi:SDR family NAD(P)-dependent oxidoreductase [Homoserinimonas sp. A447]